MTDPLDTSGPDSSLPTTAELDAAAFAAVPIDRPGPRRMLWYVLGGKLPAQHRTWVLRDLTCRTWAIRQLARPLVVVVPLLTAFLLFVPGPLAARLITGLTFSAGVLLYLFINMLIDNDRRAVRAGYPSGLVADMRGRRQDDAHHLAVVRRRERIAQRRDRRLGSG